MKIILTPGEKKQLKTLGTMVSEVYGVKSSPEQLAEALVRAGIGELEQEFVHPLGDHHRESVEQALKEVTNRLEPIPDYGDLIALDEFREDVESGGFTDDDGSGNWATETEMSDIDVNLRDLTPPNPKFTHVVWFNK